MRDLDDAELLASLAVLRNADVVVATCIGSANDVMMRSVGLTSDTERSVFQALKFPIVVIDEASQATEPATLVPLMMVIPPKKRGEKKVKRFMQDHSRRGWRSRDICNSCKNFSYISMDNGSKLRIACPWVHTSIYACLF